MARIGGAFPFPTAQPAEGGGRFSLPSGGTFYPPAGQYLIETDVNTIVETFDPVQGIWQTWVIATNGENITVDGVNWRIRNTAGSVGATTIIAGSAGSGATPGIGAVATGATIAFAAPTSAPFVAASGYLVIGGAISAVAVTSAGTGWLVPPVLVIDPPPQGGVQATAVASISGGALNSVTVVSSGGGYPVAPNIWIIPQTNVYQGAAIGGFSAGTIPPAGFVNPNNAVPGNQNTIGGVQGTVLAVSLSSAGTGGVTGVHITNNGGGYATGSAVVTLSGSLSGAVVSAAITSAAGANATVYLQPRVMQ